ncbi:AlbA family DNA-binding domain-containing protein [Pararhodonellum marinum]|uniref:AlbA family DNA-binding domain-containing protein n=1 Tax=Pararhodonellum marinum TaxID=2755358 RepID=UPI00188F0273|nr:ATP-binding protein [Pararhodonellum marinum]
MLSINKNKDYIQELLRRPEDLTLDFKQGITDKEKIAKTLCAFANTAGGLLVVGVSDDRKVIGIDVDEEMYMLESANEKHCLPPVSIKFEIYEVEETEEEEWTGEKYLLMAEVSKSEIGPHLVLSKNGEERHFIRQNDQSMLFKTDPSGLAQNRTEEGIDDGKDQTE